MKLYVLRKLYAGRLISFEDTFKSIITMSGHDSYKDLSLIIAEKQKIIDQLNDDKQSLLKIISHDIRSPFNQLFALLQLMELEMEDMPDDLRSYLDKMYHAVIGGMEMIKNLHDMRAIDQERMPVTMAPFMLQPMLNQVIRSYRIQARLKSIRIESGPVPEDLEIISDQIILKKILENLLSNAIKYPEPESTIKIGVRADTETVSIEIRDEGPGIPENEMDQIFVKFKKLSNQPSMGENTTGLGLFLANQLAGMIDASLRIENIKEGGLSAGISLQLRPHHSE